MKKIDINTSHNIVVNFELASLGQRILAAILDIMFMSLLLYMISIVFSFSSMLIQLAAALVFTFYHLISEIYMNGQSLGKKILSIKVVAINGSTPSLYAYYMRWVFRIIDITGSIGTLAILSILSSKFSQRIGDHIAQTVVVRKNKQGVLPLNSLLDMNNKKTEVIYTGVTAFTDEDMMLVKDILSRSHGDAYNINIGKIKLDLFNRLTDKLNIEKKSALNKNEFLQQVLNDYIHLTR